MSNINGTKWYKVDFHMHTNASSDYNDLTYSHRNWLLKCMEKELDCVVISDHNTGKNIDAINNEYNLMKNENLENFRELIIFPSIELTVNSGVHLLVIFPEYSTSSKITSFLGTVRINGNEGDINAITQESLTNVLNIANNDYKTITIPAHVDEPKGIFTVFQGETLQDVIQKENIFALEQINKDFPQPQVYKDLKLQHHRVIGSDSHKLEDIARRYTYVKMGLPNFDGLKVALSDKLNSNIICSDAVDIAFNPNDITWEYISNITIQNGYKIGNGSPTQMNFSPWLNSIIGGRGSGKSTIIKMLQYVYGEHQNLKDHHPDKKDFFKIGSRSSSGMLKNDIEVSFKYHQMEEETTFKKTFTNYLRLENEDYREIDYKTIQEFYPVTIITQKELFDKALHPEEIFSLINTKIDYFSWEMEFNQLIKEYEESKSIERNLHQDISDKKKIEELLKQTDTKLKTYEKYNYAQLLKEHAQFKNESTKLRKVYDEMNNLKEAIQKIDININFDEIDFLNEITPDITNVKTHMQSLKETILKQIEILDNSAKEWGKIWKESQWNVNQEDIKIKFEELSTDLKAQGTDISQYNQALEAKEVFIKKLQEIHQKENLLSQQIQRTYSLLTLLKDKREELYNKRKTYIDEINSNLEHLFTKTRVKFSIKFLGDVIGSEQEFRKVIQRQDTAFEAQILQIDDSTNENSGILWNLQQCESIEEKLEELKVNILLANSENTFDFGARLSNHFASIYQNKVNEDSLNTWFPKDKLTIEIISNGRNLDVNSASAGQRAAALMTYILLETKGPLIIDQPEDDLDSRMITDLIVDSFRKLKEKRQVIVVTHNPNIPVNAASEKIFEMNFVNGQINIKEEGTIQERNIRDSICQVMEGGEDALEHRFNKIIKYK